MLTLSGPESALFCLEFVGSPAVTVMEGCVSVDMEICWVARQNQAWGKMHLSTDDLSLGAELRGGTVTQHCLPTGRCAKHSLVSYSAPIINQHAAYCTDSPEVNSQTPEAKDSFLVIVWWVAGGTVVAVKQWHIWVLIWGGGMLGSAQGWCELALSRGHRLPQYLCGLSLTQNDAEPLRLTADVCDIQLQKHIFE